MSISVAMATFNGGSFLREQLQTLAYQSLCPGELVVSDDASTDNTITIVEEFARSAPFSVNLVRNRVRLGYRANFMQASSLCSGDLIAFCDQDDLWDTDKLLIMNRSLEDPSVYLSFHNANVLRRKSQGGEMLIQNTSRFSRGDFNVEDALYNPQGFTQVFRSSLCEFNPLWSKSSDHHRPEEPMAHDQWFYFLARSIGKAEFQQQSLATYRIHGGNTLGWNSAYRSIYHRIRALAMPQTMCSRKLDSLVNMREIVAELEHARSVARELLRARAELDALIDVLRVRKEMLGGSTFVARWRQFRRFLRGRGYYTIEASGGVAADRVLSDLIFLCVGQSLESLVRFLSRRSSRV